MPGDAQRVTKPSLLSLVRGIVDDAKQLVIGQYEFRKYQTLRQVAKARDNGDLDRHRDSIRRYRCDINHPNGGAFAARCFGSSSVGQLRDSRNCFDCSRGRMFIRCKASILKTFRLATANGKSAMDLEEQRLRHDIEAREMALKQKVNALKERIEHFKDMVDVKSKVQQRPGLMVVGSILAGLLAKKLVSKKHRHSRYTAHVRRP